METIHQHVMRVGGAEEHTRWWTFTTKFTAGCVGQKQNKLDSIKRLESFKWKSLNLSDSIFWGKGTSELAMADKVR